MMRNFFLLSLLLLAVASGCRKKVSPYHQNQQSIRLNLHSEPPTLDARKAIDISSIDIIAMCFEGLMKRGKDQLILPALAYKYEASEDGRVYTFYLRPAKWWDGKEITAYDFENTWKTILDPHFPSGFANDLYVIQNGWEVKNGKLPVSSLGVFAVDQKTLRVELKHPIPYFLDLVASHSFMAVPAHIANLNPKWADEAGPQFIGNGPYRLKEWKHHNRILLEKNPLYWDQHAVRLKEIELSIIEDSNTELNMFESGELDWAGYPLSALPTDALQALKSDARLNNYPLSGTYYYIFNVQSPPFDNIKMRKAFSLAIHRQMIIDNITQSNQAPATSLIPPTIWEVERHFEDHDLQEARRLFSEALDEMGFTKDSLPKITLIYNSAEAHHKIAQAIQEQWHKAFGIRVGLSNVEWKVFLDELAHKQFQIARMGGVAGYNDPMTFFDQYKYPESSNNFSGWSNAEFTHLLEIAERTADVDKRKTLLRKAESIFMAEMPIAPIYYYQGSYLKKPYLKGVQLSEFNDADFKFAFLEAP